MTREEALRLLRGGADGVREWNRLVAGGATVPDLRDAFLINAELCGIDLRGAFLIGACLRQTDLRRANLAGAQLNGADLRGADLRWADLRHANLSAAVFGGTLLACDLARTIGLDATLHLTPSVVDVAALLRFRGQIPTAFLRGCGLPDADIAHFQQRIRENPSSHGCFICHCEGDRGLAAKLHTDFQNAGLRCWKWNYDTQFCEQLLGDPDLPIDPSQRMLLIASRHSLLNESINLEIERAIEKEARRDHSACTTDQAAAADVLHVVRSDDFIFHASVDGRPSWAHPCRDAVLHREIIDATGWDQKPKQYKQTLQSVLRILAVDPAG